MLVGAAGFEPTTPASQTQCSAGLSYAPEYLAFGRKHLLQLAPGNHFLTEPDMSIGLAFRHDQAGHLLLMPLALEDLISKRLFLCHRYLISLCKVYLRNFGLNFLSSNRLEVLRRFFIVAYREVPGASVHSRIILCRTSFDFRAMLLQLYLYTLGAGLTQYGFNAVLVDRLDRLGRHAQFDPTLLLRQIEPLGLQVYTKPALDLVMGM